MKTGIRSMAFAGVAAILMVVVAAPAGAVPTYEFALGVVIPYAIYDDTGRDTVVGIFDSPQVGRKIYWAFIDANGNLLANDFITVLDKVYVYSFSLSAALKGAGGTPGVGKGVPRLSGNN